MFYNMPTNMVRFTLILRIECSRDVCGTEKAPGFLPITIKLLGRGVVWAHGDEHKRQRRLIGPAFTYVQTSLSRSNQVLISVIV